MGSVIEDSFYPPHDLCVEIQTFLADHDFLFSPRSYSETAVVLSVESNFQLVARRDLFADNRDNVSGSETVPFWDVCEWLADNAQPYDVLFFPEGKLRPDTLQAEQLQQYGRLILPNCRYLTPHQATLLLEYLHNGGKLVVIGELGLNLAAGQRDDLLQHSNVVQVGRLDELTLETLPGGPQVDSLQAENLALHIQKTAGGAAIHLIRYDYDPALDTIPLLAELQFSVRLPRQYTNMTLNSPGQTMDGGLDSSGNRHRIRLNDVPLYCVVLLT
jgi:hypothetical protein